MAHNTAQSEEQAPYNVKPFVWAPTDPPPVLPPCVTEALAWLADTMEQPGACFDRPDAVAAYLLLQNATEADQHRERFGVMWLDSQNRMLTRETLFTGTLTQTSVYPREVVRRALQLNAAACILTHNHPSGDPSPSRADEHLTQTLKVALSLVDVRVLDHIIVGRSTQSMATLGLV